MPGYFDLNNRLALVTGASRGLKWPGLVSRIGRKLWSSVKTPARAETNGYCAELLIAHDLSKTSVPTFRNHGLGGARQLAEVTQDTFTRSLQRGLLLRNVGKQ